jgi:hypothetical protein
VVASPLGQYGPLVAAIAAVGVIGAFIAAAFLESVLSIPAANVSSLRELALLALGAVLGGAAATGVVRAEIGAANRRLDAIGAPSAPAAAANGHGSGPA